MRTLLALARDPFARSVAVLVAVALSGFVALGLSWRGIAASDDVSIEVGYVVSGGFGGLGLIGFSLGLLAVQRRRFVEARRRAEVDRVIRAAANVLDAIER